MEDFGIVEALNKWLRLKQDLKPFDFLLYRKFWEHVSAYYGNLWGCSMVLIPIRVSLLHLADTPCHEKGIAEYSRIPTKNHE